uniref:Uncharacterized protein n=1 Tax=Glossina palpalis gambiensis TaxID=67801 RepID=A0A1B0B0M6_9MUSC
MASVFYPNISASVNNASEKIQLAAPIGGAYTVFPTAANSMPVIEVHEEDGTFTLQMRSSLDTNDELFADSNEPAVEAKISKERRLYWFSCRSWYP